MNAFVDDMMREPHLDDLQQNVYRKTTGVHVTCGNGDVDGRNGDLDLNMTSSSSLRSSSVSIESPRPPLPDTPTRKLCPVFTTTGTQINTSLSGSRAPSISQLTHWIGLCTATCPKIHDLDKRAVCNSRLQRVACWESSKCRRSHKWSLHNAPTCVNYLLTRNCPRGNFCGYAHNEKVFPDAGNCNAFSSLGYCQDGPECGQIHWLGAKANASVDEVDDQEEDLNGDESDFRLSTNSEGKSRTGRQSIHGEAKNEQRAGRRVFSDEMWVKEPEELLTPETNGELAFQADFVPF